MQIHKYIIIQSIIKYLAELVVAPHKSLIQGNPSYREIISTRGTPRKYRGESLTKGNQLYKEASNI